MYSIQCIMPQNRSLCVSKRAILVAEQNDGETNENTLYYDQHGKSKIIPCTRIGEMLSFEYMSKIVFLHEKELLSCLYQSIERSDQNDNWLMHMRKELSKNCMHNDISLRHIGEIDGVDVGHGVFTEKYIPCGSFIGEYVGLVSSVSETITRDNHYNFEYPTCDGSLEINAREYGNLTRFINHSKNPNAEFKAMSLDDIMHIICVSIPFTVIILVLLHTNIINFIIICNFR